MMILGCKGETRHLTRTGFQQGVRCCLLLGTIPSLKSLPFPNFPGTSNVEAQLFHHIILYTNSLYVPQEEPLPRRSWNRPRQLLKSFPALRAMADTHRTSFYVAKRFERFEAEEATLPVYIVFHTAEGGCLEDSMHVSLLCISKK